MWHALLKLSLIGDTSVFVVEGALTLSVVVLVLALVLAAVPGLVVSFAMLQPVHELALIRSFRFDQHPYLTTPLPFPCIWLFLLNAPEYSYFLLPSCHTKTPSTLAPSLYSPSN